MSHANEADYRCPRCNWTVRAGIPHECNFQICHKCNGKGTIGWREHETCDWCNGDGLWHDRPEEDKGALVPA